MVGYTAIAKSGSVFTRCRVFHSADKDLNRILPGAKMDDFEGVFHNIDGSGLLASTQTRSHKVIHKSLHNVNLRLAEPSMLVASHAVWNINGFEGDIALQTWGLSFDAFETPFPKELHLLAFTQLCAPNKRSTLVRFNLNVAFCVYPRWIP